MAIVETLKVYFVEINPWREVLEHLGRTVSIGDKSSQQPAARASLKIATAHSLVISGALYVVTTTLAPRRLLLIWLLQQTPIGSVEGCPDRRFLRRYASFKPTSPVKRLASSAWRPVAGPMASSALDADIGEPTNWQTSDAGSVLAAGTKSR